MALVGGSGADLRACDLAESLLPCHCALTAYATVCNSHRLLFFGGNLQLLLLLAPFSFVLSVLLGTAALIFVLFLPPVTHPRTCIVSHHP
jgi:hypothetical protein